VPTLVRVVQLDYETWYRIGEANGDLDADERPVLNDRRHLYYLRHKPGWNEGQPFWPDSHGFTTLEEAKAAAEATAPSPIVWRKWVLGSASSARS
jgi:hypothetical protein